MGQTCGEPQTLGEALIADKNRLRGLDVISGALWGGHKWAAKGMEDFFRITAFLVTSDTRDAVKAGKAHFVPARSSEVPAFFEPGGILRPDVALIQVTPPNSEGVCSLGASVAFTLPAALNAKTVIAEMNDQTPWTYGQGMLHISKLHYVVESSRPLMPYVPSQCGAEEKKVAEYVAELVPDAATIEVGIGAISEAILAALSRKRDLGFHAGMITDGVVDLMQQGVLNCSRKTIDKGKVVCGLLTGTRKLFDYADHNPKIELRTADYTHDPRVMAQLDNFIAINAAVEIDITGQVNAESVGDTQLSGVGGQADFVRGALFSRGGKSIIAMTSTAQGGKASRIVPQLAKGAAVTTPRYDVQYVVTEYGTADLRGKSLPQRAQALISIAHPSFRDELSRQRVS